MLVVAGAVIALIVVFTGSDSAAVDPTLPTTEGPSSPGVPDPTTEAPTDSTSAPPVTDPSIGGEPLDLEGIIEGLYSPPSFNGTWSSGNEVLFRSLNGDLIQYDVDTDTSTALVQNTSVVLQQSGRVVSLSPDKTQVVLAYSVTPVYRYSFLARYATVDILTGNETDIVPTGLTAEEAFLQNFVWGPSGTAFAYVYLNNIFYQESLNATPVQITTDGRLNVLYNGIPDWVYEEEVFGSNNAIWFSNDGNKIAYVTFNDSSVRIMRVPHYGVPGSQYTQHHEIHYPKSGTTNPNVTVTLRDLTTSLYTVYSAPGDLNEPILKTVRFVNNDTIALMWTNRVQTTLKVEQCTAASTTCTEIYSYTESNGWIDNIPLIFNEAGNSFITILPQLVSGELYKQIVQVSQGTDAAASWSAINRVNTAHTVLEILHWISTNGADVIWYKATGVSDTAQQHIYTVTANGVVSCFTCDIRREDGSECLYNEASISNDGGRVVINCAGPDVPQVFIYHTTGSLVRVWDDADELRANLVDRNLPTTIRLSVPIAGASPADVHIQAPANYRNLNNVPLLVYVYGGPDTALVTKQWNIDWGSSLVSRWNIAVAHIDGRGSGLRGVANMFALNRKLGTVEIEDQINVTRYLQENLSWIDANRTCIWGWSYGGYAASKALAEGGSVFRCAAAVAPVVDWRFYDTIYTERYMDLPSINVEGYSTSSLLKPEVAEALRNKSYFLIHGTADDNVHYQHAMLFSRLLQRNDVYFNQMSYTDEDHGLVGVRPHLYHAIEKFLQEHML